MTIREIESRARRLRSLQAEIEAAEAEADAIREEIKAYMGEEEELRAGEYKITYRAVTTQRIDTTAFRKAMPEVAAAFTRASTVRRFCLS